MIVDRLEHWAAYPLGAAWECAVDFLTSISANAEEQRYPLQGDDVYALVMSYETRCPDSALFEAHRGYVDVQAVLSGSEALEWASIEELQVESPFDSDKDVELYRRCEKGATRVSLFPGTFVLLLPHDAHMPGLVLGDAPERVKKAVVKVRVELLLPPARNAG